MAAKQKMDQKAQIQKELEDLKKQVTDKQNELTNLSSTTSVQEHRRRAQTYGYYLSESEVQQAQVVLAAQDMVDKMQGMIEDTTEMQFKELPALVDSIKNQIGVDQAAQFNNDAQAALTGLVQNLQGSKQQLEQALGVVTGQGPVEMPGTEMAPPPPAGEEQIDLSMTEPSPEEELDAAAVGPAASLGRERR
jgi:chromosome segregation ATPase